MSDRKNALIIDQLLVNLTPELIFAVEEACEVGAKRAHERSKGTIKELEASVVGQLRFFENLPLFHTALENNGANPSPLAGNRLVTGQLGNLKISHMSMKQGERIEADESVGRRELARLNEPFEPQLDLFDTGPEPSCMSVFFISRFANTLGDTPETPVAIEVGVPNSSMTSWLFLEKTDFLLREWEAQSAPPQADKATSKLKEGIKPKTKDDRSDE